MSKIQGIVVPGFFKPYQTLVGVRFPQQPAAMQRFKSFLGHFADHVSNARVTLKDRRNFRQEKLRRKARRPPKAAILQAIAFSFPGLCQLGVDAEKIPSRAFRLGMAARSAMLGDPVDHEGSPSKWEVGGPGKELDALFVVAGNDRPTVSQCADDLVKRIHSNGAEAYYREDGDVRPDLRGSEHFGFSDGVSQPGIRGLASNKPRDFITDRHISPEQLPTSNLFGYPGQELVWPGTLVLGWPGPSPDPQIAGVPTAADPPWTINGSFLVFRRLVQDVGLFWRTMRDLAQDLALKPGFEQVDEGWLAARLVGRWPSGAPVNRVPDRDFPALGSEREANNHFRFDSDCHQLKLNSQFEDPFPMSTADPLGITCPWASHIRKVNTRDSASDMGGRESSYTRRLLRVGVPFGPPLLDRFAMPNNDKHFGQRGLLFLSIQASIEEQFEFLTARWMGDPARPKMPGGHDILVGQNDAAREDRERRCTIFGQEGQQAEIRTAAQWIIPTGGGYFFVPSIPALRNVLAKGGT